MECKTVVVSDFDFTVFFSPEFRHNCWLWFTYFLALAQGFSPDEAREKVEAHARIYQQMVKDIRSNPSQEAALLQQAHDMLMQSVWRQGKNGDEDIPKSLVQRLTAQMTYREGAEQVFAELRTIGSVAMATGAFDEAVKAAEVHLGLDGGVFACSNFLYDEKDNWIGFSHNPHLDTAKLEYVKEYIKREQPDVLIVIGDGSSDEKIFAQTAHSLGVKILVKVAVGDGLQHLRPDITVPDEDWTTIPDAIKQFLREKGIEA